MTFCTAWQHDHRVCNHYGGDFTLTTNSLKQMLWNIKADKKGERPLFKNNKVDPIAIDCIVCLDYRRSLEPNINALKEMKEGVYLKWFRKQITFYQKHLKAKHGGNIIAEIQKAVNS